MIQFKIIQTGNQIETQSKTTAAIPIFFRHNPKYLQMSNHVFNHDAFSGRAEKNGGDFDQNVIFSNFAEYLKSEIIPAADLFFYTLIA